jgi:hypothetical protein
MLPSEKTGSPEQLVLDHRNRAEQFRTASEATQNPVAKRLLREMADAADELADRLERHLATLGPSQPSS